MPLFTSIQPDWTSNGKPSPAGIEFDLQADQKDMNLKEVPQSGQVYDFSLLDSLSKG